MNKSSYIAAALFSAAFFVGGCQAGTESTQSTNLEGNNAMSQGITELVKIDTLEGSGREAEIGFNVTVHYTGWLYDASKPDNKGQKFDSSVDRGEPFVFYLGGGQVIQGWDQGFAGMKIGGKRTSLSRLKWATAHAAPAASFHPMPRWCSMWNCWA